jgi:hypothetical protein
VTVAAWVKTERAGAGVHEPLVTKGSHAYSLAINGSVIEFSVYSDSTATWTAAQFPIDSTFNGSWRHIAGTFDGLAAKLYIDGVLQSTVNYAGLIAGSPTQSILIGSNSENLTQFYQGAIDDVRVYDTAISGDEALAISAGTPTMNPIGHWRLDGPGSSVTIQADPPGTSIAAWPDGTSHPAVYWTPAGGAFFRSVQRQLP